MHQKSTHLIKSSAEAFRIATTEADVNRWSAGFTMAKALDTIVDDDHDYDSATHAQRLLDGEQIPHLTPEAGEFVRTAYHTLSPESQDRWQNAASQLGAFAIRRLEATDIYTYIDVVKAESGLMADTLMIENTPEQHDYTQRQFFNGWLVQMARTAYLADTLSDIVKDHNDGNSHIRPTFKNVAILTTETAKEMVEFAQITPAPIYIAIGERAVTKTLEKVRGKDFWRRQFIQNAP